MIAKNRVADHYAAMSNAEILAAMGNAGSAIDEQFRESFRAHRNDYNAEYNAGKTSRFLPEPSGLNSLGAGADSHYPSETSYFRMVERARFDDMDNCMVGQGVDRVVSNVMQEGFALGPKTGDDEIDDFLRAKWEEWSGDRRLCDYDGERTFNQLAELYLRDTIVAGDIIGLPLNTGQIQTFENHHLRSPYGQRNRVINGTGIVHGVEIRNNRRVALHILPDEISGTARISGRQKLRRVPILDAAGNRQAFHVHLTKRYTQHRGVTAFAPTVYTTKYFDDLQFAALVNAKRNSFIAVIREMEAGQTRPSGTKRRQSGSRTEVNRDDGTTATREGGSPGQTIWGDPGEKIKPWSPTVPTASFFDHTSLLLAIIAVNLDLPPMVFTLDASSTNFNGYRGVIDQARLRFRKKQLDLRIQFHREVYLWKVRQWLASDPLLRRAANRAGINIFNHAFTPQGWPYIQPVQDAAADITRLNGNLIPGSVRARERGIEDYGEFCRLVVGDRVRMAREAMEQARNLNDEFPEADVNWRELYQGNAATGVTLSLSGSIDDENGGERSQGRDDQQPQPQREAA